MNIFDFAEPPRLSFPPLGADGSLGPLVSLVLRAAWWGIFAGVVSGAWLGLGFHRENFLGGYGSFRRRLCRLGHISFFGLGLIEFLFAFTARSIPLRPGWAQLAAAALLVGAATMPAVCFLSAWRPGWRRLFPLPVGAVAGGLLALFAGWPG